MKAYTQAQTTPKPTRKSRAIASSAYDDPIRLMKIFVKCWEDPAFKKEFLNDPLKVLTDAGITLPPGLQVVALENEPGRLYIVLPTNPAEVQASFQAGDFTLNKAGHVMGVFL